MTNYLLKKKKKKKKKSNLNDSIKCSCVYVCCTQSNEGRVWGLVPPPCKCDVIFSYICMNFTKLVFHLSYLVPTSRLLFTCFLLMNYCFKTAILVETCKTMRYFYWKKQKLPSAEGFALSPPDPLHWEFLATPLNQSQTWRTLFGFCLESRINLRLTGKKFVQVRLQLKFALK